MTQELLFIDYRDAGNKTREFCDIYNKYLIDQKEWQIKSDKIYSKSKKMSKEKLKADVAEDPYREYLRLQINKRDLLAAFDELIYNSEDDGYGWINEKRNNTEVKYLKALRMAVDRCKYDINPEIILSLQQLEAMQNNKAAKEQDLRPESAPRKELPKQIRDMLPNMTPQEMVEAMKPYEPTGWEVITALQAQWPEMENYRAGAYANGIDPDDPDRRKTAENFYQRHKPREGK